MGPSANLLAGWLAVLCGVISGGAFGLYFHRDDWMGGYGSYRRRLIRLGHISFPGLGLLNLAFAITAPILNLRGVAFIVASVALIVGAVSMPTCCFLAAWRKPLRHFFPVPVVAVLVGVLAILFEGQLK
jgi:hypothetical protein